MRRWNIDNVGFAELFFFSFLFSLSSPWGWNLPFQKLNVSYQFVSILICSHSFYWYLFCFECLLKLIYFFNFIPQHLILFNVFNSILIFVVSNTVSWFIKSQFYKIKLQLLNKKQKNLVKKKDANKKKFEGPSKKKKGCKWEKKNLGGSMLIW
jgi:hypothetical protein